MKTDFDIYQDTEGYRDHIATVDEHGKRLWIYPKKPSGRFYQWRNYLSWVLLAVLFGMPFIKVNGEPLLLFNVLERRFILFGIEFMPQDFHLFVLAMLTLIVFIILFTVIYGRIFCGWICPQTIFMEMVFRKIEYWIEGDANAQRKLAAAPWTTEKILKKGAKQALFFAFSVLIANTFLAYIIGIDEVVKIISEPVSQHFKGFLGMVGFSFIFFFVFARLREQVCIAICPYGRLQGVLLDKNSIAIMYDWIRGEPRGKLKKAGSAAKVTSNPLTGIQSEVKQATLATADPNCADDSVSITEMAAGAAPRMGDCIDCKLCIHVCPTGIDIRNGTQLECINCTACIDACDEVMDKIGKPRGLIRYDSYNGVAESRNRIFTPRVIAYTGVLLALIALNIYLLGTRTPVEAVILRTPGMLYQETPEGHIRNLYNYQVINKALDKIDLKFKVKADGAELEMVGEAVSVTKGKMAKGAFFIDIPKEKLESRKNTIFIEVYNGKERIDKVKTNFLGPIKY